MGKMPSLHHMDAKNEGVSLRCPPVPACLRGENVSFRGETYPFWIHR